MVATESETIHVECDASYKICTWFMIGQISHLEYNMYDVAVRIENQ